MKRTLVALAVLAALPLVARAEKPGTLTDAVELTTKIEAIDHAKRLVTLKDKDGEMETIYCGPEVKRFDELKVGDTVTIRYQESIAWAIRKPGQPSGLPTNTGPAVTRSTGARPGGTVAQQETATVTIKAIDPKVPSVTVLTEDGRTVSFKVEDKKNLKDVKVGDKVEITYTEAVIISVK
jgi:ribosomal 50S subunit-recycling heat shock protein